MAAALAAGRSEAAQPEVVCDLTPVLAGAFEGSRFRSLALVPENAEPIRLTFRDIDPKAGRALMIVGVGASCAHPVGVAVETGAIVYLYEKPGQTKMLVTTQTKPTDEGWPALMSQHGWEDGVVTIKSATGLCRMRTR